MEEKADGGGAGSGRGLELLAGYGGDELVELRACLCIEVKGERVAGGDLPRGSVALGVPCVAQEEED